MRIIIVGCGKVGSELAGQLSAAGHDLTLIDLSERRLNELSNMYDLATVKGSGTSYHVLREAGVQDTDLLIAVTTHDEIKNRVLRTENYEDGELSVSSETVYTEVDNGQSSAVNTVYDADGNELMVVRMGMNTNGDVLSSRTYEGEDNITSSTDNRYDSQGRLIQSVTVDESGIVLEVLTVYSVDGKTQTTRSTIEGGTLSTDTRTFDDNGNLVSMHQTDSDGYASDTTYTQFK